MHPGGSNEEGPFYGKVELPLIGRTLFKLKLVSPELPGRLHS